VPEENDLALAKLVAWREKDISWLKVGVAHRILSLDEMAARLDRMPAADLPSGIPNIVYLRERLRILRPPS
jgi:hypothetical protein